MNGQLSTHGVVYNPDKEKGIECYVYDDFEGGQAQSYDDNAENVMSREICNYVCGIYNIMMP